MKDRLYFRLGLLVTGALVLLVGVLFFLGMAEQFAPRIKMFTTFEESVQGLTVGASVKLQGVPIGVVDSLIILPKEKLIRVDMSIDPEVFVQQNLSPHSGEHFEAVRSLLRDAARLGLRCRLEMAGVTGLRYVEMSFLPPEKCRKTPLPEIKVPGSIYVASAPGTFSNIIDAAGEALTKISKVDFEGISRNLDQNLDELQEILRDPAIKGSLEKINNIAANLEVMSKNLSENVTGEEIQKLFDNANHTLDELNKLNAQVQGKLAPVDTGRISQETADTLQAIRVMTVDLNRTRIGFERTMQQLNSFLASTGEFIDMLKRDPNALLRGKSSEPVIQHP